MSVPGWYGESLPGTMITLQEARHDQEAGHPLAHRARVAHLMQLIAAHRPAFRQERTFRRAVALLVGEIVAFARHTVTQVLLALSMSDVN